MKQALLIVDVQPSFNPPKSLVDNINKIASTMHSIATVERHDEAITPFWEALGWKPAKADQPLITTHKVFVKHGYLPPPELVGYLNKFAVEQVLVCGLQADRCCLAAGFVLFDAGLRPTMLKWLTIGSSLDRSAGLGAQLWRHHFGQQSVVERADELRGPAVV